MPNNDFVYDELDCVADHVATEHPEDQLLKVLLSATGQDLVGLQPTENSSEELPGRESSDTIITHIIQPDSSAALDGKLPESKASSADLCAGSFSNLKECQENTQALDEKLVVSDTEFPDTSVLIPCLQLAKAFAEDDDNEYDCYQLSPDSGVVSERSSCYKHVEVSSSSASTDDASSSSEFNNSSNQSADPKMVQKSVAASNNDDDDDNNTKNTACLSDSSGCIPSTQRVDPEKYKKTAATTKTSDVFSADRIHSTLSVDLKKEQKSEAATNDENASNSSTGHRFAS